MPKLLTAAAVLFGTQLIVQQSVGQDCRTGISITEDQLDLTSSEFCLEWWSLFITLYK